MGGVCYILTISGNANAPNSPSLVFPLGCGNVADHRFTYRENTDNIMLAKHVIGSAFGVLWLGAWLTDIIHADHSACEASKYVASIAGLFGWVYVFISMVGFRTVGPFVMLIRELIIKDLIRFLKVYSVVLLGFTLALYLVIFSCKDPSPEKFFRMFLELPPLGIVGSAYGPWEDVRNQYVPYPDTPVTLDLLYSWASPAIPVQTSDALWMSVPVRRLCEVVRRMRALEPSRHTPRSFRQCVVAHGA